MQQTLSVYLLTFAIMTLFHGTLSDSFGRRPIVLANLLVFVLASLGCALAATFEQLLVFRGIQGLSAGAGIVVGRAIIRDSLEGHAAQRLMSLVTMIFGVAPAIAPIIGGWLQAWFGWRSVFVFLVAYGAILLLACKARLPETLPRHDRQPFRLGSACAQLLDARPQRSAVPALLCNRAQFLRILHLYRLRTRLHL